MKSAVSAPRPSSISQSRLDATRHARLRSPFSSRSLKTGTNADETRRVGDERADRVRDEERDLERVDLARRRRSSSWRRSRGRGRARARSRSRTRRSRSRRRAGAPAGGRTGRPASRAGIGGLARAGGRSRRSPRAHDTRRCGRARTAPRRLCYHRAGPLDAGVFTLWRTSPSRRSASAPPPTSGSRTCATRSTIKTLTKRLAAAVEEGDADDDRGRAPQPRQADRPRGRPRRAAPEHGARKKSQAARLASTAGRRVATPRRRARRAM